jgi:hypothetical protein
LPFPGSEADLLVREEELEVLKLAAGVLDLISVAVESVTVLVLSAGLVVSEHAHAVLHGENFVIDTTVVAVLVAQVVEALTKLGNELILLTGSDLDSRLHTHITN